MNGKARWGCERSFGNQRSMRGVGAALACALLCIGMALAVAEPDERCLSKNTILNRQSCQVHLACSAHLSCNAHLPYNVHLSVVQRTLCRARRVS